MQVYAVVPDPRLPLREVAEIARRAERLGYTGLWVPEAVHDGLLAALIALEHTSRLEVATSVLLAFPRSPTTVAYAAWDLQSHSGGRFSLGLGSQVKGNIVGRFGVAWKPPVPRMREYVQALRAIWDCWQNGSRLEFHGEHYRLDRMQPYFSPGPIEHPRIRVLLGGVNPAMTRLAGEVSDGLMTHPTNTSPRFLREVTLPNLAEGARRAGRPVGEVGVAASPFVASGPTSAAVAAERERIREQLGFLYSTPQYAPTLALYGWDDLGRRLHRLSREGRWAEMKGAIGDEVLDRLVVAGPYDEIPDRLREWYGGLVTATSFRLPDDPAHDPAAAKVVAALRAADTGT